MKFCCITPCLNAERYIEHTMEAVLNQTSVINGVDELHYIVQDGNSQDDTYFKALAIAEKFKDRSNIIIDVVSEKDVGMYDALGKGLQKFSKGDICSYLNAGDYYSPYAFEIVSEIFSQQDVAFLTGLRCVYNDRNHLISCTFPYTYRKNLILTGLYGTILPEIQQESTFWAFILNKRIDFKKLQSIKLAGDYYLWKTFVAQVPLYIVSAYLGGFKIHNPQLSSMFKSEYKNELRLLANKPKLRDYFIGYLDNVIWYVPNAVKRKLSKRIIRYNFSCRNYEIDR